MKQIQYIIFGIIASLILPACGDSQDDYFEWEETRNVYASKEGYDEIIQQSDRTLKITSSTPEWLTVTIVPTPTKDCPEYCHARLVVKPNYERRKREATLEIRDNSGYILHVKVVQEEETGTPKIEPGITNTTSTKPAYSPKR